MEAREFLNLIDRAHGGRVVVLTGAGISAESGIPTFRGPGGYWTVGSTVYRSEELGTHRAFQQMPREIWRWYLYRAAICRSAAPNDAHRALAELEGALGDRFTLITQNVDGLHRRAGSTDARIHEIHGNLDYLRAADGSPGMFPMPPLPPFDKDTPLDDETWAKLVTPDGRRARPHVLWFDEYYDEPHFRAESALRAAGGCDLMLIVGTSGSTALPHACVVAAEENEAVIVDINPHQNPFSEFVTSYRWGAWVQRPAGVALPAVVSAMLA